MGNIQVPKLRVPFGPPDQLLKLYNRLGEQNPALGKWVWEGTVYHPTVLMLVPSDKTPPVVKIAGAADGDSSFSVAMDFRNKPHHGGRSA